MATNSNPPHKCYASDRRELYFQNPWKPVQKRMPVVAEYETPGPNAMAMPSYLGSQIMNSAIVHSPAWSLHPRIERKLGHYPAGPLSHDTRNLKAKGGKATAPAYSMRIKPETRALQQLPGPASYKAKIRRVLPKAPAYSFRGKPKVSTKFITPGPNEYTLPRLFGHHHTPPTHVMGQKYYTKDSVETPGPGDNDHTNFIRNLPRQPQYKIGQKIALKDKEGTPGPGAYCPEKVIVNLSMAPHPSMGIKHSPYSGMWHPRIVGPRFCPSG